MTSLVLSHLMNGIVNGVKAELFGTCSYRKLAFASSALRFRTLLDIGLGIPYHFPKKFRELGCVLGFLKSITLESLRNLRISLALSLTTHGEVHSHFRALTVEMVVKSLHDLRIIHLSISKMMLTSPVEHVFLNLYKFV